MDLKMPEYRLVVKLKSPSSTVIPYDYRQKLLGMFYSLTGNVSPDMADKLHNAGYTKQIKDKRKYKFYTHNLLAVHAAYYREGFTSTNDEWEYWFASADPLMIAIVEHAISNLGTVTIGNTVFEIKKGIRVPLKKRPGQFRCAAPIVVYSNDEKRYLIPYEDNYNDGIIDALLNRYQLWTGNKVLRDEIKFRFTKPRRRDVNFQKTRFISFSGKFELDAPPELLKFAQLVGLGQKNSIGMGMIA